ncbi:LPXTG cell wall anchor domain-containing protein OS=Streptomyces alboniger OX=132473 GN=CP975_31890 PE=4 SV=1 [Streptomyces alboniger]
MRTSRMRTTRALAVAAAAGAVVGLAVPAASAWADPTNIVAMPSVVPRGGQLTVTVDGSSCQGGGRITSHAFPDTDLQPLSNSTTSSATAVVHRHATPGAYDITAHCGGKTLTRPAAFTVIHGGVRGGFGGSTHSGATDTDMAIGGALVAAAVIGGGVFWMRRRSENKT